MRKTFKIIIILVLLIIYTYIIAIQSIPNNIVIFEGEELNLRTFLGLEANLIENNEVVETVSSNQENSISEQGHKTVKISLFENIFVKNINVDVIERTTVIPVRKFGWDKVIYQWSFGCRNVRNKRSR